ncbi:MAG: ABC transporter permease [Candidatus Eisenbacteria bacterium]|nr:ABC transporter permease [Candidatus Eisenbacteria bacterium]
MSAALARVRVAAWLGWQVDSNWADPALFVIYVVARPLAVSLILVAMYWAVSGQALHSAAFAGFFVANAFHSYVNTVVVDLGWVVFSEREEYETLKYVYASPMGMPTFLLGRSAIKFGRGTISVLLSLALGWWALGVRWDWSAVQPLPLALALALGLFATLCGAMLLAGACLVLTRAAIVVLDGVTLALYLLCGVIFPVDLLPPPLRALSLLLPWTWWYEAIRRFLLGTTASTTLAGLSDAQLLGGFALVTAGFAVVAGWLFRWFENRARALGRLDQTTMF